MYACCLVGNIETFNTEADEVQNPAYRGILASAPAGPSKVQEASGGIFAQLDELQGADVPGRSNVRQPFYTSIRRGTEFRSTNLLTVFCHWHDKKGLVIASFGKAVRSSMA